MKDQPTLIGSYLNVNNRPVYHYVAGQGTPLLLIHGARCDALRLDPVLRYAARTFKVYAPDLPGFGKSAPFTADFKLTHYGEFIRQYIKTLQLKDFYLFGASMGGVIAIHALKPNDLPVKKAILAITPYDRSVIRFPLWKLRLLETFARMILATRTTTKLFQKIVDSDRIMYPLVNQAQPIQYRRPEIIRYELKQWRVMPIEIHLKTMLDTVNVNFSQESFQINTPAVVIYPKHDHYINNQKNLAGLAKIFPDLKAVEVPLERHSPPGKPSLKDFKGLADPILDQLLSD